MDTAPLPVVERRLEEVSGYIQGRLIILELPGSVQGQVLLRDMEGPAGFLAEFEHGQIFHIIREILQERLFLGCDYLNKEKA